MEGGEFGSWLDHTTYQFPSGIFSTAVTVTHTLHDPATLAMLDLLHPIIDAFNLTAVDTKTGVPIQPRQPYSLTVYYTEAELGVVIEPTLALYFWDGQQWMKETNGTVDLTAYQIVATPIHTTLWAIAGGTHHLFLPVIAK